MKDFDRLYKIVAKLRKKCPWDKKQTHASLKPYMIEETYEALHAIDKNNYQKFCEELGDMLLHILMHAVMAKEKNKFDIHDIIDTISSKMVRRHPHVFGKTKAKSAEEVWHRWEKIKKQEKGELEGLLESIPETLPALLRAEKVQKRAARIGFDWNVVADAFKKIEEETNETKHLLKGRKKNKKKLKEEIGDLIFAVVNVARKLNISAEEALQFSTAKFVRRFDKIEEEVLEAEKPLSLKEMDVLWEEIKAGEK